MAKKKIIVTLSIITLSLVFFVLISSNLLGISTTVDLNKCKSIVNQAKKSISQGLNRDNLVIYCSPGVEGFLFDNLPEVSIYDFTAQEDLDVIIDILKKIDNKPFDVTFYEKENMRIMRDSSGKVVGKRREKEVKIKNITIK